MVYCYVYRAYACLVGFMETVLEILMSHTFTNCQSLRKKPKKFNRKSRALVFSGYASYTELSYVIFRAGHNNKPNYISPPIVSRRMGHSFVFEVFLVYWQNSCSTVLLISPPSFLFVDNPEWYLRVGTIIILFDDSCCFVHQQSLACSLSVPSATLLL